MTYETETANAAQAIIRAATAEAQTSTDWLARAYERMQHGLRIVWITDCFFIIDASGNQRAFDWSAKGILRKYLALTSLMTKAKELSNG